MSRSPPVSRYARLGEPSQPSASTACASGVAAKQCVMRRVLSQSSRWRDDWRAASGANQTLAPVHRYGQISQTAASKPMPAVWLARIDCGASCSPYARACHAHRFARPRCGISTPFGAPVVPDV
ncbi:hypothetical protein Y030_1948 [Burkholderia pseudomallei MSHR332]|nr:hypothetical protein Y030_1948 [Burkholderia pseudomallei MSHR332]